MNAWSITAKRAVFAAMQFLCCALTLGQIPSGPPNSATLGEQASEPTREQAVNLLMEAYTAQVLGTTNAEGILRMVTLALEVDPDLAYAHVVRAEIAMKAEDWETARVHYEKGLSLLKQPRQPLSPMEGQEIPRAEVEGDARCFLGYVYIKLAQRANWDGDVTAEQTCLGNAMDNLESGLALSPSPLARELAADLLTSFR